MSSLFWSTGYWALKKRLKVTKLKGPWTTLPGGLICNPQCGSNPSVSHVLSKCLKGDMKISFHCLWFQPGPSDHIELSRLIRWISRKSISKGAQLSCSMYKFEICFATEWINWKSFSRRLTRVRRPNWPIGGFKDQQMQAAQCTVGSSHFSLQKCRAGATHCAAGETKIDAKKLHSTFLSSGVKLAKIVTHSWINSCNRIERTHFKVFLGSVSS